MRMNVAQLNVAQQGTEVIYGRRRVWSLVERTNCWQLVAVAHITLSRSRAYRPCIGHLWNLVLGVGGLKGRF